MNLNARTSETSDLYMNVVANPLHNLRIAVCRNGIQWLIQKRDGERHGAARWATRSYAMTKPGLIEALRRFGGLPEHDVHAIAGQLPHKPQSANGCLT